ncbi:MAG: hypothetical protein J6T89_01700 [Bacteroidales bacterium]|nr:hypothetical protein [Bacteroidales bacterium]
MRKFAPEMKARIKNILIRYAVSTLGLLVVAFGVAVSIKSNLGIAPPSCPPTILNLRWGAISVGSFTWIMHLVFILLQLCILRRRFKLSLLMQIPAAFVFGYMCDGFIWLLDALASPATSYPLQLALSLGAVVVTAIGIKLEVLGGGWTLAGDMTTAILADETRTSFGTTKIIFDITLVVITAVFAFVCFGTPVGNGFTVVIREGTLILAVLTGACMKLTDPLLDRLVGPIIPSDE